MIENKMYDLVVAGGGLSGVCAAVAAARLGLHTALIQDRPVLGGNCSSELCIGINGAAQNGHSPSVYAREGGIVEELKTSLTYFHFDRDLAFFELVYAEKNIDLYLNTLLTEVEMEGTRILSVEAKQLSSERTFCFTAPIFIDCTGDGTMAFKAGAEFMYGREAKSQFGESLAPDIADDYTLGDSMLFWAEDVGKNVEFHRPSWAYEVEKMPFFKNLGTDKGLYRDFFPYDSKLSGYWWVEFGGQADTIYDNEDIALELRKINYGLWDYMKNSGQFKGLETFQLTKVAPVTGKRESRRFIGDVVLTQGDIDNKTDFEDAVGIAGWEMDVHAPKGIYDDAHATHWHYVAGAYNIPFSMMYSKNIDNLMLAGRDMSASHVAFGSTRLACQGGVAGQAAGTAAYLCKKYSVTPREVKNTYIHELQGLLLKNDQTILGYNEIQDTGMYEGVSVIASSEKEYSNLEAMGLIQLTQPYVLVLPSTMDYIESVKIKVKNFSTEQETLTVRFLSGTRKENYIPEYMIREITLQVEGGYNDWLELPADARGLKDDKLYIMLEKNPNLRVYANNTPLTGAVTFTAEEADQLSSAKYKGLLRLWRLRENHAFTQICFRDVKPEQNMYCAQNLLNGYSRPYGTPNLWVSQSGKGEEWLEINFEQPRSIHELQIVFNTMLEEDNMPEVIPTLVRKYDLELLYGNDEMEVLYEMENYKRVAKHILDREDVRSIRINLRENGGSPYYEIFAVKIY